MAGRPCKPDADFERLWRMLLPGTPFPACGVADRSDSEQQIDADDHEPPGVAGASPHVSRLKSPD
jgi:hypothetical protein